MKKDNKLLLGQPHCLILYSYLQTNGLIRLVHHNLTFCCFNVIHNLNI